MKTLSRRLRELEERLAPKVDAEGRTPADVLQERFRHRLEEESGEAPDDPELQSLLEGCRTAVDVLRLRFRNVGADLAVAARTRSPAYSLTTMTTKKTRHLSQPPSQHTRQPSIRSPIAAGLRS